MRDQIEFYREQARPALPTGAHGAMPDQLTAFLRAPIGTDGATPDDLIRTYCPLSAHCLELASGAGRWTEPLLAVCEQITAVDTSPEMHAINRELHGDTRVEYVEANMWELPQLANFIEALGHMARVIAYDHGGFGASDPIPDSAAARSEEFADDIHAVLDAADSDRATLFEMGAGGHSTVYAAAHPDRVRSLILANFRLSYPELRSLSRRPTRSTSTPT